MSGSGKPLKEKTPPRSLSVLPGTECVPVFHITHVDNLETILRHEGLFSHNDCSRLGVQYRRIGDASLKDTRSSFPVQVPPHGCLGDYVPFYLGPRSPMQFRIHRKSVAGYDGTEQDVIFLVSTVTNLRKCGFSCFHTDGQANANRTKHIQGLDEVKSTVDWTVIRGKWWLSTDQDPDRQRRRSAEVLVHKTCPFLFIEGIAAANNTMVKRVATMLDTMNVVRPVVERPGWYYGGA